MASLFYRTAKTFAVAPSVHTLFRPWVKGLDNIPTEGPAILAANHMSFFDSILVPVVVPRQVHFLAKSDYWSGRGVKGTVNRWFFNISGQIPMDRSGGRASQDSLDAGENELRQGHLLGIYPEGTRSPDGRLYRGKLGVAKLALKTEVPVIPIALIGTDRVQPIGSSVPRPRRAGVIFGEPLTFPQHQGRGEDRFAQRAVTDDIMSAIMRLSGQEYVDTYASTVKAQLEKERAEKRPSRRR